MLRPFLIVGVGGSGGKTIRALKVSLDRKLKAAGWKNGIPDAWQFLHIDTPTVQDGIGFPAPFLPNEEYIGIVSAQAMYEPLVSGLQGGKPHGAKLSPSELQTFGGWIPDPADVKVPVNQGAGQFRGIGRTLTVSQLDDIRKSIATKFTGLESATAKGELLEVAQKLGQNASEVGPPMVLVISSIAGGSGAGAYLDVVEAIKACSGQPWAQRVVAWLYTPDVFEKIDGKGGVAPNALSAISETMNGLWSKSISPATQTLYQSKGINPVNLQVANVGPAYTFLVGRKNNKVDFESQEAVYLASSGSLAAFMTDATAQDDFWAYYITNLDANGQLEAKVPDKSRLKVANVQRPPFMAMGFGQVSMGRDRFSEFASQRLTRDVVERLLFGHERELPPEERREKTPDEKIQSAADGAWLDFLEKSKLNERNPANDVVNAIAPLDLTTRTGLYAQRAMQSTNIGSKGASPDEWTMKLVGFFNNNRQQFQDEDSVARRIRAREWVAEISEFFPAHVSDFALRVGLPSTSRILNRLVGEIDSSIRELEQERDRDMRIAMDISSGVSQALNQGMATLAPNHAHVQEAIRRVGKAFDLVSSSDTYGEAVKLLRDFTLNVVQPIIKAVETAHRSLDDVWGLEKLPDGSRNPKDSWPDPKSDTVPASFKSPINEQVLTKTTEYVKIFTQLVNTSVPENQRDKDGHNASVVARAIALGKALPGPDGGKSTLKYTLLETMQSWVPVDIHVRPNAASATSMAAKYRISSDPFEYVKRTEDWMDQPGGQFEVFMNESLADFLADGAAPDGELAERRSSFVTAFGAALKAGTPLVDIDVSIASAIHPGIDVNAVAYNVSAIPFDADSKFAESLLQLFPNSEVQQAKSWFKDAPKTKAISFTTFLSSPLQPMVLRSVMGPIENQWGKEKNLSTSREGFYKWRRARPLIEYIPAAPQQIESMVRGWLLADLLGHFKTSKDEHGGAMVEVWDPKHGYVAFPYPLLHPGLPSVTDYMGVVLESLAIAMALSSADQANPLRPFQPYHRLLDLGGEGTENPSIELSEWVTTGRQPAGAPPINGEPGSDTASRREFLIRRLQDKLEASRLEKQKVDEQGDPYKVSRAWETHVLRETSISQLTKMLGNLSDTGEM